MKIQHQTLWDTVKAALRGKFLALNAYTRKEKMSHINNLSTYLKNLEKEKQIKPKVSKRKEIIKLRVEIKRRSTYRS